VFSNVVSSKSYTEIGNYNYKKTPQKALQFKLGGEIVTRNEDASVTSSKNNKVEPIVTQPDAVSLNTLKSNNGELYNKKRKIELSSQTRLKFNAREIRSLADSQIVFFHINAEANRYKSDSRKIHGIFTCKVSDIKTFFDWDKDKDWNNNNTHSWSKFPVWAEIHFKGNLGNKKI
jgi:hypothetical protein